MIIDRIFWWVGAVITCSAGVVVALLSALFVLWSIKCVCTAFWVARFFRPQMTPAFDMTFFRFMSKIGFAIRVIFGSVPDQITAKNGAVLFDRDWLNQKHGEGV